MVIGGSPLPRHTLTYPLLPTGPPIEASGPHLAYLDRGGSGAHANEYCPCSRHWTVVVCTRVQRFTDRGVTLRESEAHDYGCAVRRSECVACDFHGIEGSQRGRRWWLAH